MIRSLEFSVLVKLESVGQDLYRKILLIIYITIPDEEISLNSPCMLGKYTVFRVLNHILKWLTKCFLIGNRDFPFPFYNPNVSPWKFVHILKCELAGCQLGGVSSVTQHSNDVVCPKGHPRGTSSICSRAGGSCFDRSSCFKETSLPL